MFDDCHSLIFRVREELSLLCFEVRSRFVVRPRISVRVGKILELNLGDVIAVVMEGLKDYE